MKKFIIIFILAGLILVTAGCAGGSTGSAGQGDNDTTYTIKIGHVLDENYHYQDGANKFKELVEERSDGRIEVEVYANSALGDERDMLEGMQLGTVEMGIISSGPMAGFVPEFALLDLGYLFEDNEVAQEVLNGPIGERLNEELVNEGIRRMSFIDAGFRNIYANEPVETVEDLQGIRLRTLETPAHLELFEELGASPTPMAFSELYTALQQGVVDGAENVPEAFESSMHYEVSDYYSETNHVYLTMAYLISEDFYESLPEDLQEIVTEAVEEAAEYHNEVIEEVQEDVYDTLAENNVTIVEVDDISPFVEAAKASWVTIAESVDGGEELLEEILEETGQTLD